MVADTQIVFPLWKALGPHDLLWKICGFDLHAGPEHHRPFDRVLQFPDVAGPGVRGQALHGLIRDVEDLALGLVHVFAEEEVG